MENSTSDYYARFGMSAFDFNSMIRSRFLDDLIERLVEKGIVCRLSAENNLASVEEQTEPVQTQATVKTAMTANVAAGSPVTVITKIDRQPRQASSVYSRDIDGNSYRSASTLQEFSSRSASFGSLLPPLMSSSSASVLGSINDDRSSVAVGVSYRENIDNKVASCPSWASVASLVPPPLNVRGKNGGGSVQTPKRNSPSAVEVRASVHGSSGASPASSASAKSCPPAMASQGTSNSSSSSRTSLSSPVESVSSSATSASNIRTSSEGISDEGQPWPRQWLSSMKKTFRSTSSRTISITGSSKSQNRVEKSCGNSRQRAEDDFRAALFDLQQRSKQQQHGLPDLNSEFDQVVELGRLRRTIPNLDLDNAEMILVVSDMTTCVKCRSCNIQGKKLM